MSRPTRVELLRKFFPELGQSGSPGDREQAAALSSRACEVILLDLINLFDRGRIHDGDGVLAVRLQRGSRESSFLSVADLQEDRDRADAAGDGSLAEFLSDVLAKVGELDAEKVAAILLIDNSGAQLFPVGRDYPAAQIQALMAEAGS